MGHRITYHINNIFLICCVVSMIQDIFYKHGASLAVDTIFAFAFFWLGHVNKIKYEEEKEAKNKNNKNIGL